MFTHILTSTHTRLLCMVSLLFVLLGLSACASTPVSGPAPTLPSAAEKTDATKGDEAAADVAPASSKPAAQKPVANEPVMQAAKTDPVRIDVSCKNEPFSQYEKQSRDSIAKGLSATKAGTYAVGFRNLKEHKKWSKTHGMLFTSVNQACSALSKCAKQHSKDKAKQCAQQAKHFVQWQQLAEEFAKKAKQSETSQPPKICSFVANLDDAAGCFHALADNIDKVCTTGDCKETSDCWRGIGFLDYAINQAASSCRFSHQPLSECHSYITTSQRRKNKFNRCQAMQKNLHIDISPAL